MSLEGVHSIDALRHERTNKRIRAFVGGHCLLDTTKAVLVWVHDRYPHYWVPKSAFISASVQVGGDSGSSQTGAVLTISSSLRLDLHKARWQDTELFYVAFNAVDLWLEEDEPIFVHVKDPYKRVDIVPSSRPIRVFVDKQLVAESSHSVHLFETSLPTRYYLPLTSAKDLTMLRPSSTTSLCPYKGQAHYYSITVGDQQHTDLVWSYRYPTRESLPITGLICFYNEKVDIELDGEMLVRPKTHFS